MTNWYVVQVQSGREETMASEIRKKVGSDVVEECFVPRWETQTKVHHEWRFVRRNLIPGYVIVVTKRPQDLAVALRAVPGFAKVLRSGGVIAPLEPDEVAWMRKLMRRGERVVPMSSAVKEGDRIVITDGPLCEVKSHITRIDRRKSTAYVEIKILGRTKEVPVGLKIIAKSGA